MTRLSEIEAHIGSMGELFDIVGAMRALAGMHMQEAQRTLPGIRRYAESVAAGIADALLLIGGAEPHRKAAGARKAVILFMAEHGFVGGFNERILEAAQISFESSDAVFVLGSRGASLVVERGGRPIWTHPMATRCASAPDTIQRLSEQLYRHIAQGEFEQVELIHASYRPGSPAGVERRLLLPLDLASLHPQQSSQPPFHNLAPVALLERLIAEYVFALLTEAAVQSIVSENAARLAAMESAHDNVSRKLEMLRRDARHARQSEITTEILELVTATKAIATDQP